jgi:tetratricopeptide (TPR) repeat protein
MKLLRGVLVFALIAVAFWPELARYRAERRVRAAADALRLLAAERASVANAYEAFGRVAEFALSSAPGLPGDPRPFFLAGSAHLAAGDADRALVLYGEALARGERAETDLNLGRVSDLLANPATAKAAYIRGGWVSPALLDSLPPETARSIRGAVMHLEAELAAGRLAAPPPLP